MRTVLITGVAGFIGSHLSERLLSQNMAVVGIDNFDPFYARSVKEDNLSISKKSNNFHFYETDIRDQKSLTEVFKKHEIDVIVHLAARAGVRPSLADPAGYVSVNVEGLCSVLETARLQGISKIVFGSSSSVYGTNEKTPFCETDTLTNMISPYAMTKKSGEDLCQTYHNIYKMSVICLRFFTVYGPRQRPDLAIHKFLKANMNGNPIEIFGDGSMSRDYTYVADTVAGIEGSINKLLGSDGCLYDVFNLGNSTPVTLKELISCIEYTTKKPSLTRHNSTPLGDVPCTFADISRAEKELNYKTKTKLENGLAEFYKWMENKT